MLTATTAEFHKKCNMAGDVIGEAEVLAISGMVSRPEGGVQKAVTAKIRAGRESFTGCRRCAMQKDVSVKLRGMVHKMYMQQNAGQ